MDVSHKLIGPASPAVTLALDLWEWGVVRVQSIFSFTIVLFLFHQVTISVYNLHLQIYNAFFGKKSCYERLFHNYQWYAVSSFVCTLKKDH